MELIPAIDLRDGRCVRLLKGDFERETRYASTLSSSRRAIARPGRTGCTSSTSTGRSKAASSISSVERMRAAAGLEVQLGGGIRSREALDRVLRDRARARSSAAWRSTSRRGRRVARRARHRARRARARRAARRRRHAAARDPRLDASVDAQRCGELIERYRRRADCATCCARTSSGTAR